MRISRFGTLAILLAVCAAPLPAQEHMELGKMWTFDHPPLEYLKATYGFSPSQPWLDRTRLASVRLDTGCSASFVSPRGLILTNHHCVRGLVARVSPPGEDWVKNGFAAHSLNEEVKLPGLTISQLVSMEDVTERMNAGIRDSDDDATIAETREKNKKAILEEARNKNPKLTPQVVSLYQGGMFKLYSYRKWDDIRLCLAPHLQTAHFGGDYDNFTYPRYGIDFSLIRAYENGEPADTSEFHFDFNEEGPARGELVFVTGNPGTTRRLFTKAEMEYDRDVELPITLAHIRRELEIRKEIVKRDPAQEERQRTRILSLENSRKAYEGYLSGLLDESLMEQKAAAEELFKKRVMERPELARKYGGTWKRLEEIIAGLREAIPQERFLNPSYSPLLVRAMDVIRAVDESLSKEERETAARAARRRPQSLSPTGRLWQTFRLGLAMQWLPENHPFVKALGGPGDPGEILARLERESTMRDDEAVKALLDGGAKAVEASKDPAIAAARVLVSAIPTVTARVHELEQERSVEQTRIGQALFAVYGTKVSPDATFTLRLSDGVVKGFPFNGTIAPPWTVFYGLYARNVEFENEHPFDLPQPWLERRDRIDMTRPVDFVSTNDIIGGNSGSPVINVKHEVVGLIFDGNIEMLPNRYLYRDTVARAVSVHAAAIMEAMLKIYEATDLAAELRGKGGYK